jgi:hypothetical protein
MPPVVVVRIIIVRVIIVLSQNDLPFPCDLLWRSLEFSPRDIGGVGDRIDQFRERTRRLDHVGSLLRK